ncbi:3'-5' exoribonuclease HELZ2-like isoform X2 [Alosa pseudoharengus]|uniref:3'-5' exoribonuclease HELZ2-like isoform X2 n=1 Tax=Alosa pseudoharengus TaxID=34774 RepID=UPI003F8C1621
MAVSEYDISILNEVLQTAELRIGCSICTTKEEEITYSIKTIPHKCQENLLLAKLKKDGKCWRPISKRPEYPNPMQYDVCWFFAEGSGCTVHRKRCTFARSPEEVLIWNFLKRHFLDLESLISLISELEQNVSNLEGVSENIFADWSGEFQELCRECFNRSPCRITERESSHVCGTVLGHRWTPMMVHCLEQSPGNRMFSEIRPLPPKALLQLCCHDTKDKSPGHIPLECQFAHNKVELAVWKQEINSEWNRMELLWLSQKRRQPQHSNEVRLLSQNSTTKLHTSNDSSDVGARGPVEDETSYQDRLLKEYRDSDKTVVTMAEHVDEVDITHDEDLYLECQEVGTEVKWTFQIKTERLLSHVALLKNEPGAIFNLGDSSHNMACTYSVGNAFVKSGLCYEVTVTFTSSLSGLFEQWLVFDFDIRPVLLQKLKVRVGQSLLEPEGVLETFAPILERWHRGNRDIIPYLPHLLSRTQDELLKTYELPQKKFGTGKTADSVTTISRQNYKERMHNFLFEEERVEAEMVSRLDFRGTMTLASPYKEIGFRALPGGLFGTLAFSFNIAQGAPEGFLLKREVDSVLVGEVTSCDPKQKVYEAVIIRDVASDKEIHLQLSRTCCLNLDLQKDQIRDMEVQFQLNRLSFCEMHKAIDLLPDLDNVLPDFTNSCVPSHSLKYPKLNANQQAAMEFILGELDGKNGVAPLLIYGPFGTGKTFTLASAAKEVVCQSSGRVLICTLTNSSADIYVNRHFHQYFEAGYHEVKPLRIKKTMNETTVRATDVITLKYCLLSPNGQLFIFPMKHDLDSHRIVIITTSWAKNLHDLKLPENYFSHIMIDEASQMLESEALMALGLAGPKTRIVLAGDHMQVGPKLFSVEDHKRSDHTLLNRLFHYYQSERKNVALESRIIFNENYRSNKEIVNFVSTHFYTAKRDTIRACGNVPAHPKHYPLRFHHVRGEWHLHPKSQSWYNLEEAETVVNIVGELLDDWPAKEWGPQKAEDICVLSEGHQVQVVREKLRRKRLGRVLVQNLANVQGKQFRVIVMTAVQTRDQLLQSNTSCLEFFNDARVLNTAMTRAQSEVIVVGDSAALCFFGKCSKTWKCYIEHCIKKGSAQPDHLTEEFLRKEVEEISRFQKAERNVDAEDSPLVEEDQMDLILQQMINDYADENSEQSEAESVTQSNFPSRASTRRSSRNTHVYKQGQSWNILTIGYTVRSEDPSDDESDMGRGIGHTARSEWLSKSEKDRSIVGESFLCILKDDFQHREDKKESKFIKKEMVSINKDAKTIRVLLLKRSRDWMPIWNLENGDWKIARYEHIDEKLRQKHLFIVQVICWKDNCYFPLGKVIDVLPIGTTVDEGLRVLDAKFKMDQLPPTDFPIADVDEKNKPEDLRKLITFTIDPFKATHLDDAISVKNDENESHYEVGVHIVDVASVLRKGDLLDRSAEERGATYYRTGTGEKPIFMFPESVSMTQWSLLPNKDRRVISLIINVDKETGSIIHKTWQFSLINSNRKLSYEEVEDILSKISENREWGTGNDLKCDTLEDCIAVAYRFSQTCRKGRLQRDWLYSQPDKYQTTGRRRSHIMVEELNIMFNHEMSRYLIDNDETKCCCPLRCQKPPDEEEIRKLKERYMDQIPMSAHLKHLCGGEEQNLGDGPFTVLSSTWSKIKEAALRGQYDIMADLIGTDDWYPQLLPVISKLRDVQGKAYFIRSNSGEESNVGHYSLAVDAYTHASSPIRHYMDVVLQRLFHSAYSQSSVQYSQLDIDKLCKQFEKSNINVEEYERQVEIMNFSISLSKQSSSKLACVVFVNQQEDHFTVSFLHNKGLLPERLFLHYRDLLLDNQPKFDQERVKLKWRRRVYTLHSSRVRAELRELEEGNPCIKVPRKTWHDIVVAVQSEDWATATDLICTCEMWSGEESETESGDDIQQPQDEDLDEILQLQDRASQEKLYTMHSLHLKHGETLKVQLTAECHRGSCIPRAQLLYVKPNFVVCVEHAHQPTDCFSKQAERCTKDYFKDVQEYVKIWKPLCQMVSASSAVGDGDSITIEDVQIAWEQTGRRNITGGSFSLPMECIKKWRIECDLAQCYLCIKKRNLKLKLNTRQSDDFYDPCTSFTWVVHGVVTSCERSGKKSSNQSKTVKFYINHRSMTHVPNEVLQDSDFSVELIPKLPPDVRTENAINNIVKANDLVQNIALGWDIKRDVSEPIPKWHILKEMDLLIMYGLPDLNESQQNAIVRAVNNKFTLIQGPPGTGKTVVGAYIAYLFCKRLAVTDPEEKKEVVLYCGPSHKSVDVVAEYLLNFEDGLKPLRVYSKQIELQEFRYPGSTLQLSRKSRQEKSSPQLRSITLHYRIRDNEKNPYSKEIKAFDEKIKRCGISEPEAEEKEIEGYKEVLNKAREYELKRHNVILCTCTAASSASLTKFISAKMILIDECAMATEPQALVPLVSYYPQKIVLLGDHKQLRPIVTNERAKKMGMSRSLFERCITSHAYKKAATLNTQYRMHEEICEFPSSAYYKNELVTASSCMGSVLQIKRHGMTRSTRIVFVDIRGKEISQFVSTKKGNEKSVRNRKESVKATKIAGLLVNKGGVNQEDIAILSPYNAQVSDIKRRLNKKKLTQITVCTITKSQGSEWRYVILSVVRSCPIKEANTREWRAKHIGFVGDANQINVGITRAQDGLCILGFPPRGIH